jgi:protein O-mannosyl-transferase
MRPTGASRSHSSIAPSGPLFMSSSLPPARPERLATPAQDPKLAHSKPAQSKLARVVALALGVVACAIYTRCLFAEFISFDDPMYVVNNRHLRDGLTWAGVEWAWTTFYAANWHPLVWMSLLLDHSLFGLSPWGYHLTNLLLHAANTVLLFYALREATGELWRPCLAAALFAVHPLHVESVAWVTERKDVLSGLFWMASLWAYLAWARRDSRWAWWLALAALAVGLTAKQMLVTLPCVFVLMDLWPLGRWSGTLWGTPTEGARSAAQIQNDPSPTSSCSPGASPRLCQRSLVALIVEKWPMFAIVLVASVAVVQAQSAAGAISHLAGIPLSERLQTAITAYGLYLVLACWPVPLSIFYPYHYANFGAEGVLLSGAVLVAISVVSLWKFRQTPALTVGWLWYLGTFVPVIGLVQVGQQSMADRYTYIPFIGLGLMVAWLLPARLAVGNVPHRGWLVAGLATAVFAGITVWQTGFWMNSERLFARSLEVTTNNHLAHFLYAERLRKDTARQDEALWHFKRAAALDTVSVDGANAWVTIGRDHETRGEIAEAEACYRRAIAQVPTLAAGLEGLAALLIRRQQLDEGIALLEQATRSDPDFFIAHFSLGMALMMKGDLDRCEDEVAMAFTLNPEFTQARDVLDNLRRARASGQLPPRKSR